MKLVMTCLLILALSGFVVAVTSEIEMDFSVGRVVEDTVDHIPSQSFWDVYGIYVILLVIILIIVKALLFSKKKVSKVKVKKLVKKKTKIKKVSKKKKK